MKRMRTKSKSARQPKKARAAAENQTAAEKKSPSIDADSRARILEAARDVFAETGFDGARVRSIAERAQTNLGLLPYYFGDKTALWKEVMDVGFNQLTEEASAAIEHAKQTSRGDPHREIETLLRTLVRFLSRTPSHMRLMLDEIGREGERTTWLVQNHLKQQAKLFESVVVPAQKAGALPDIPWSSLYYMIIGAVALFFLQRPQCKMIMGVDPYDPKIAKMHEDALVKLFIRSKRASSR